MTERHQFAMETYKTKRVDRANKARLTSGKLYIKDKIQTAFLVPTLPDPDPDTNGHELTVTESDTMSDSGSIFKGYSVTATSLSVVTSGLNEILASYPDVSAASHVIYAYRVKTGQRIYENFCSDDDHGMGHELLKLLRNNNKTNVLCVVTRHCAPGFIHLGRKRFEHLRNSANGALGKL